MTDEARDIVDWAYFEKSRAELGPGFIRILSYFKEDGTKSIAQIEPRCASRIRPRWCFPRTPSRANRASSARSRWPRSPS